MRFLRWSTRTASPYLIVAVVVAIWLNVRSPGIAIAGSATVVLIFGSAAWFQYVREERAGGRPSLERSRRVSRPWPKEDELLSANFHLGVSHRKSRKGRYILLIPPRGKRSSWIVFESAEFWNRDQFPHWVASDFAELIELLDESHVRFIPPSKYSRAVISLEWPEAERWRTWGLSPQTLGRSDEN